MKNTQQEIIEWFSKAVPNPTQANKRVQIAVHIEEFAEMFRGIAADDKDAIKLLEELKVVAENASNYLKSNHRVNIFAVDPVELLDSLCDQQVTANGVGWMFGYDMIESLAEVSASNNSKFVDGMPIFNDQGKIGKGPDYFEPALEKFC
jgi:predicted HAD superfamily Cof-like phosphohydrolase